MGSHRAPRGSSCTNDPRPRGSAARPARGHGRTGRPITVRYFFVGAGFCAWLATHAAWASRPRRAAGETQWRQRLKSMVMCSVSVRRPARSPPVGPGPAWTIDGPGDPPARRGPEVSQWVSQTTVVATAANPPRITPQTSRSVRLMRRSSCRPGRPRAADGRRTLAPRNAVVKTGVPICVCQRPVSPP